MVEKWPQRLTKKYHKGGDKGMNCPKQRENDPLARPLVLIIKTSSVVREERHSSLTSELSEEKDRHVKKQCVWGACMRVNWKRAVPTCAHYGWRGTANGSRRKSSQCYHPECLVRATGSRASGKMEKTPFYSLCFIVRAAGSWFSSAMWESRPCQVWQPMHLLTRPCCWSCFCFGESV